MPYRSARPVAAAWHVLAVLGTLLLLAWSDSARGAAIHKCAAAQGLVYQDTPCPRGATTLAAPRIDDARGLVPVPVAAAATERVAADPPVPRASATAARAAPLYRCERYDGQEHYVTDEATPRRYQVPLWAALGDAGPAGGAYTWVEDRCAAMTPREQCAHWQSRRDQVGARRRLAFRDELARLDAELRALRSELAAHCG